MTVDELVYDSKFVKYTLGHVNVTSKNTVIIVIDSGNRLDGSVVKRIAKRESNVVKRYHDKDDSEDWSKLGQWGAEYEAKNVNSRFHIQVNPDTRRLFISLGNSIDITYGCGLKFVAVDVAFSKYFTYHRPTSTC